MIKARSAKDQHGYTLIELVMVIVLIGIMAVAVAVKLPSGMQEDAAVLNFVRAVRYAQHLALTRQYSAPPPRSAWGINVAGNKYTVQRFDGSTLASDPEYLDQTLPGNTGISSGSVWFNGFGVPVDPASVTDEPLAADTLFLIGGTTVTVFQETGYVE